MLLNVSFYLNTRMYGFYPLTQNLEPFLRCNKQYYTEDCFVLYCTQPYVMSVCTYFYVIYVS